MNELHLNADQFLEYNYEYAEHVHSKLNELRMKTSKTSTEENTGMPSVEEIFARLINNSFEGLPTDVETYLRKIRKNIKRILCITITGETSQQQYGEQLDTSAISESEFKILKAEVKSGKELRSMISNFLNCASDVWIPVVLITCEIQKLNDEHVVVLENERIVAESILTYHKIMHKNLKIVFHSHTAEENVIYSNAIVPKLVNSVHLYLCYNAKSLTSIHQTGKPLSKPFKYEKVRQWYFRFVDNFRRPSLKLFYE